MTNASERYAEARRGADRMRRRAFAGQKSRYNVWRGMRADDVSTAMLIGHPHSNRPHSGAINVYSDELKLGCPAWK